MKEETRSRGARRALGMSRFGAHDTPRNKLFGSRGQTSNVIRLPIFRDGVFIGNEFCPIGPGLRRRIREMVGGDR